MVREACDLALAAGTLKEIRYKTVIDDFLGKYSQRDPRMVQTKAPWDEQQSWIENAHASKSEFDCVLSPSLSSEGSSLCADDLGHYAASELFGVCRQRNIKRTAATLVDCVWPLLSQSSVIRIVEPHFDPVDRRFTNTLFEAIKRLSETGRKTTIELHVRRDADSFGERTKRNYQVILEPKLRAGLKLKVFFWANGSQKLHPRYLLTEVGGIKLDYGWDEAKDAPEEETPAILLEESLRAEEFSKYQIGSAAFHLDPKIHVLELG